MKREKFVLKLLVAVLAGLTVMAGNSFSQSLSGVHIGSFTLPFEAHWGTLDLKPGAYSFSLSNENGVDFLRIKQHSQQIGLVFVSSFDVTEAPDRLKGELLCANNAEEAVIAALDVPGNGVYHFYVPRRTNEAIESQMAAPADVVPVLFAQK